MGPGSIAKGTRGRRLGPPGAPGFASGAGPKTKPGMAFRAIEVPVTPALIHRVWITQAVT